MDCAKLKADIERLREAHNAFNAAVAATYNTGLGKIKCNEAMEQTSELEDEILRTYMEDVGKHNSELFRSIFHYGEKIDGFHRSIYSTVKLSDSEILACGYDGETRILHKGEDGSWNYDGNSIDGFDDLVRSTLKLSDSEILVCGGEYRNGETRILRKGEDGLWNYIDDKIDGFHGWITSTMRLSDNEVLVCGDGGETRILHKGEDGSWSYDGEKIDGFYKGINSIMKLSDSEVLACGNWGETRILRRGEDGLWNYDREAIDGFDGDAVYSTMKLSDSEVLVCGGDDYTEKSKTRILRKDKDGLWGYIDDEIDGFGPYIHSAMKLQDNEVLVCGDDGETRILRIDMDIDLDKLKQKLSEIAAKKDEA